MSDGNWKEKLLPETCIDKQFNWVVVLYILFAFKGFYGPLLHTPGLNTLIHYDNFALIKVIAEMWEHGDVTKSLKDYKGLSIAIYLEVKLKVSRTKMSQSILTKWL